MPTTQSRSIFQFPYMMRPASDQVERSEKWAVCIGNETGYRFEKFIEYGLGRFVRLWDLCEENRPWEVWSPRGERTREEWWKSIIGYDAAQIEAIVSILRSQPSETSRFNKQELRGRVKADAIVVRPSHQTRRVHFDNRPERHYSREFSGRKT